MIVDGASWRSARCVRRAAGLPRVVVASAILIGLVLTSADSRAIPHPWARQDESLGWVVTGASLVDPLSGQAQAGQAVVVRGGRVEWTGPETALDAQDGLESLDVAGAFLVPGLIDMHVHVTRQADPLFVANGVTTVRRMHGNEEALEWRERNQGPVLGPRVFVAGPLLAGAATPWGHEVRVDTPDEAAEAVARVFSAGYDFVKIYDDLAPETYSTIAAAAREHGLPIVGHLPIAVGIDGVLAGGQRTVEHVEQLLFADLGRDGEDLRYVRVALEDGAVLAATAEQTSAIASRFRGSDTAVTPTLAAMRRIVARGTGWYEAQFDQPGARFTNTYWPDWWAAGRGVEVGTDLRARLQRFFEAQVLLVRDLHAAGVPILAGTDTAAPLMPAGYSIHDELDELVAAGLAPVDALRAATSNAAAALGATGELGVIAPGASADFLVVTANPLEHVRALREPTGVMVRGHWYPRSRLDTALRSSLPR